MLKEHSSFLKQTIAGLDCLLILGAFYASYSLTGKDRELLPFVDYWIMVMGFMFFYLYFAWTRSLFSILQFNWMHDLSFQVVRIFIYASLLGAAVLYLVPENRNSRYLYISFTLLSFAFVSTEKFIMKYVIVKMRKNNRNTTPVVVVGRGRSAAQICQEIDSHPESGLRVIYKMDIGVSLDEFEKVIRNSYVEEVLFCVPRKSRDDFSVDPYLKVCEEMGRPARVFINMSSITKFARWEYHRFMGRPTLISHTVELDPDQLIFKRIFDVVGAIAGTALLVFLYPFLALLIKATSRGPVFFKQVRVGKNGKRFVIYKFRTMSLDAEIKKRELEKLNECKGAIFKVKNDPRITAVGRVLRKLSLDELPQFLNVLKGEMSLVGTRPPTPDEVGKYQKWHHRRISIRPGITGLWQVSGRNKITDFDEIVKLDLKYIDSWSIWLDVKIIIKTILVVFKRDSAF